MHRTVDMAVGIVAGITVDMTVGTVAGMAAGTADGMAVGHHAIIMSIAHNYASSLKRP